MKLFNFVFEKWELYVCRRRVDVEWMIGAFPQPSELETYESVEWGPALVGGEWCLFGLYLYKMVEYEGVN